MRGSKYRALLRLIDAIIDEHGEANQQLKAGLAELREKLEAAYRSHDRLELASIGLRVLDLARWIFDHLPPPH